jgi:hypothetical protein
MMKKFFTRFLAALALLTLLVPLTGWGQTKGTTDVIDNDATSSYTSGTATSSWVTNFSITGASGATYYIHTMGTKNTSNALQFNSNGFLYMTGTSTSGEVLKSITITGTSGKSLDIFAQTSAYSAAPSGSALATMSLNGSAVTYSFASNTSYTHLAIKGKASSTSIVSISIEWESAGGPTLESLSYTGTPTTTTYEDGDVFDPTGLTVYANYSDNSQVNVTADVVWTPNPLTVSTTSVTGTYGGKTVNVGSITVTAAPDPDIVLNASNSPFTATSSNTNTQTVTLGGIEYQNYGGYNYTKNSVTYLSVNPTNGYLGNNTQLCGNIKKIVVDYNTGGASYMTMYEGSSALDETTTVTPSATGTGKVTYTFTGNTGFFKFKQTTAGTYVNINSISIYLYDCSVYHVTYNANGATSGNVPTDDTEYDENNNTVTVLGNTGNLAKEHYAFGGWNTAANGSGTHYGVGEQFEISTNTTLYAEWAINKHSYILNVTGEDHGEVEIYVPDQDGWATGGAIEYGQQVTVSVTPATHYVYSIAVMAGNDPVTVENDMFTMPDSDVTITVAVTEAPTCTITFNAGTGSCATPSQSGHEQDQITLPTASPSEACALAGWEFAGWATASVSEPTTNAPTLLQGNSSYTITSDAILYAVYKLTEGGSSTSSDVTLSNGEYSGSGTSGKITWTEDYITILQEKGTSASTNVSSSYIANPRWYQDHIITLTPSSTIDSVDIFQYDGKYGLGDSNTAITNGTASVDNNHVARIIPTNGANDIVITMGAQARINGITVYYTGSTTTYNTNPACAMPVASVTVAETEVEVDANAQEGAIEVTYENLGETILADVEFYEYDGEAYTAVASTDVATVYPWITVSINNDNNNVEYVVSENAGTDSRPAYFRVYALNGDETVYSDYVTITQLTPADTYYEVQLFYALPQTGVIHVKDANNETVVHAKPGTELYLTFDPYECYTFSSWSVSNISATPAADVTVTAGHFTMPAGRVRVAAATTQSTIYEYLLVVNGVNSDDQSTCTNPLVLPTEVENVPTGFTFAGWTTNENDVEHIITEYTFTNDDPVFFYAVYGHEEGAIPGDFTLVTEAPEDWSGNYLIAYDDETFADGRIGGKDDDGSIGKAGISVKPETNLSNDGTVVNGTWGSKYYVTLEKVSTTSTTYLLKTQDGQYNYQTSNSNGLYSTKTRATAANNPLSISLDDNGYTEISIEAGAVFHYNPNQGGFFRFYSSGSQKQVYAYKQGAGTPGTIHYYTRVFFNETATDDITIAGPSIIPSGSVLNMDGNDLVNEEDNVANLVIEDGGQVKLAEGNTGVYARVQKNITGYGEGNGNWYLLCAPTRETLNANPAYPEDCPITNFMPADQTVNDETVHMFDLYKFDQNKRGAEWQNYRDPSVSSKNFISQEGRLYARKESATIEFNNVKLAAQPNEDLMYYYDNAEFAGWSLIGNAMMCNQYVALFTGNHNYVTTDYYRMNAAGTALVLCDDGAPVAPLEGIFVQAPNTAEGVFVQFSSSPIVIQSNAINLNVSFNNVIADRARVRFGEGSMLGKFNFNESATQLYIPQGNKNYAVVRSNGQGEMPVNFKAEKSGTYTISVEPENVEVTYLHLIDNRTGANVDLLANPNYTFEANKGDYANRFRLVFKTNANVEDNTATETFAYFNGSEWVINNPSTGSGSATLQVIDMMGRVLRSEQINGNTAVNINETAGIYMLRLVNGENVMVQKVVVR